MVDCFLSLRNTEMNHNNTTNDSEIFLGVLRPIIISMKIFGLYFDKPKTSPSKCQRIFNGKTYSVLILVLMWANILRLFVGFFVVTDLASELPPNFRAFQIVQFTWTFLGTLNHTICFYGFGNKRTDIHEAWVHLKMSNDCCSHEVDSSTSQIKLRRQVLFGTLLAWAVFISCTGAGLVSAIGPFESMRKVSVVITTSPAPPTTLFCWLLVVPNYYSFGACAFPLVYQIIMCVSIQKKFSIVTRFLKREVDKSSKILLSNLEATRIAHKQICQIVDQTDKIMSLWMMSAFITCIPQSCFLIYTIVNDELGIVVKTMESMFLLVGFINVLAISVASSIVNSQAHSPLTYMYDLDVSNATPEQVAQLQLFLSRLNGPAIGYTALGLITVTKEAILTIAGLYLTYIFLVLQFQI